MKDTDKGLDFRVYFSLDNSQMNNWHNKMGLYTSMFGWNCAHLKQAMGWDGMVTLQYSGKLSAVSESRIKGAHL